MCKKLFKNSQPFGKNFQKTLGGDFFLTHTVVALNTIIVLAYLLTPSGACQKWTTEWIIEFRVTMKARKPVNCCKAVASQCQLLYSYSVSSLSIIVCSALQRSAQSSSCCIPINCNMSSRYTDLYADNTQINHLSRWHSSSDSLLDNLIDHVLN